MYIDHDVLLSLFPFRDQFVFYPCVDIPDAYVFIFLRMLQELNDLPYVLEVLHVEIDSKYGIPTAQLYSSCPKIYLDPILDRYGFHLRKAAGLNY